MKVMPFEVLVQRVQDLKSDGNTIVLCHGCFDLLHPGHIKHFQAAKKMGDVLVVTVTPDRYIDKGSDRPVFSQELRVESIAALACVDYAAINRWPTAEETLRKIVPDYYVKGQEFKDFNDKTGKLQREIDVVQEIEAKMRFTSEVTFSSTELLNKYFLKK